MSGEQSTRRGPLTGKVLYADGTDDRFDELGALVEEADGRITHDLEPDLFAIVTDDIRDDELVDHALANGSAVLTPENAIKQIAAQLERVRKRDEAAAAAPPTDELGDTTDDELTDSTEADEATTTSPRNPLHRRIDWEKLAAIGAVVMIVVFAINVWNDMSEERARYEADVQLSATETRTVARCTTLASGDLGETLVFNELLAESEDRDGTFWSDVVDEMVILCGDS